MARELLVVVVGEPWDEDVVDVEEGDEVGNFLERRELMKQGDSCSLGQVLAETLIESGR